MGTGQTYAGTDRLEGERMGEGGNYVTDKKALKK